MTLADIITAPRSAYYLSVNDTTRTILLDFGEPSFITRVLASDCGRFGSASFQTVSAVPGDLSGRDTFAWGLLKMYYSAFYAGQSLLRSMGESCTFFYKNHTDKLVLLSDAMGLRPGFKIDSGLYHCLLDETASSVSYVRTRGMAGGAHEAFWQIFGAKIRAAAEDVLSGPLATDDAQEVYVQIDAMLEVLSRKGGFSWLSHVRNELQYRLQYDAWFPARQRQLVRTGLSRIASQWDKDPMKIDIEAAGHRHALLGDFVASCVFIVALCRDILLQVSDASELGNQCFVHVGGPLTFLNDIQAVH